MVDARFDCRATAAVLRSGRVAAMAGHAVMVASVVARPGAWWAVIPWCVLVYFAVRVELDARLFEVLAEGSGEALDAWMEAAGLRKNGGVRLLEDRRRGALRLWRGLMVSLVVEIAVAVGVLVWSPK